jgi:hypothetical protein
MSEIGANTVKAELDRDITSPTFGQMVPQAAFDRAVTHLFAAPLSHFPPRPTLLGRFARKLQFWRDANTEARDLFLLTRATGTTDSLKCDGMIYDAVVARLGVPGSGYDPAELSRVAQEVGAGPREQFFEALCRGTDAARAEGWL